MNRVQPGAGLAAECAGVILVDGREFQMLEYHVDDFVGNDIPVLYGGLRTCVGWYERHLEVDAKGC